MKKKGFCYASCESPKQFELFVEKNGSKCWINELVPSASHQALLGAVGANTQYPKFALDLEREVPGGPDPENWEEEVEDVLSAVTHVLQGIMGNKDLKPEFWTLDSSRPLARGAYKHSYHLISKNIVLDTFTTGGSICEAVDDELTRRGREDNCIDKSIYSSNRSFRVLGSNKEARGSRLQCRGDVSFEETLLTCYPPSDNLILVRIGNIVTSGKGRKRSASTSYDSSKKLRLDCPIAVQVQEFLDSSPPRLARLAMEWRAGTRGVPGVRKEWLRVRQSRIRRQGDASYVRSGRVASWKLLADLVHSRQHALRWKHGISVLAYSKLLEEVRKLRRAPSVVSHPPPE